MCKNIQIKKILEVASLLVVIQDLQWVYQESPQNCHPNLPLRSFLFVYATTTK